MNKYALLIFAICFPFLLVAQTDAKAEHLEVVFDKGFYVAGENAWFSVFLDQSGHDTLSGLVHCELLSRSGEVLLYQQLKVESGHCNGDFFIPPTWQEDYYLFRAYTVWNLNFSPQQIYTRYLPIFNIDEQMIDDSTTISSNAQLLTKGTWQIDINTDQETYQRKDSISLTIKIQDENGLPIKTPVSLAVTQQGLVSNGLDNQLEPAAKAQNLQFIKQYEREQAMSLRAEMFDVLSQQPMNADFLAVYLVETQEFQFSNAKNAKVEASLPDFYGMGSLQLYDRGAQKKYVPRITQIYPREFIQTTPDFPDAQPSRSASVMQYLSAMASRRDFAELFGISQPIPVPERAAEKDNLTPDRSFVLKDYIPFKDMETFIVEAMNTVKIESLHENQKALSLLEEESNQRFLGPPMFLIDNYITFDPQKIFEVPWKEIERIELFTLNRNLGSTFGPLGFNGVFAVYTRRLEAPKTILEDPHNLSYQGFYRPREFAQSLAVTNAETPEFRPQLYWNAKLIPDENGEVRITFKHSDDLGNFRLRVMGFNGESSWGLQDAAYKVSFDGL
ncbi:MAG: hypothetical protein AB8H47_30525 [Bacteroidia bacterium]